MGDRVGLFTPAYGNSAVGGAPSYWNDELEPENIGGFDDLGDTDIGFLIETDQEISAIGAEEEEDDTLLGEDLDAQEIGNIFRRRQNRQQRVASRQAKVAAKMARASAAGKSRRAARLQARQTKLNALRSGMTAKQARQAKRAVKKGARQDRRAARQEKRAIRRSTGGQRQSAVDEILSFMPDLPPEGKLVILPLENANSSFAKVTLKTNTKTAVSSTLQWQSEGIAYAELRLIGALIEAQLVVVGATDAAPGGNFGIELTQFLPDGKVSALYGAQVSLFDPYGVTVGIAAKAFAVLGFTRQIVIGLRDKGRIEKTNKISGTVRVFAPAQAVGDATVQYSLAGICDVIEDDAASQSR